MHDQPGRQIEHLADEREPLRLGLPQRPDAPVDDAEREQPPGDPLLPLERAEVARDVPARERHAGDEVVEDELVEDDDPRPRAQRLDDPSMRVRVVADVVERDVGFRRPAAPAGNIDLDAPSERGQEQRAVVGDAGALGGQRRVVRDR